MAFTVHSLECNGAGSKYIERYKDNFSGKLDGVHFYGHAGKVDYTNSVKRILLDQAQPIVGSIKCPAEIKIRTEKGGPTVKKMTEIALEHDLNEVFSNTDFQISKGKGKQTVNAKQKNVSFDTISIEPEQEKCEFHESADEISNSRRKIGESISMWKKVKNKNN